jgi:hypothetical protein
MREVRENLQRVQERLETQPNISAYDKVSQNYIHAIESINEKLHDTTISQSEKIKYGKELNTLVHNFEKHQKKSSQKKINPQTSVPKFKPPEITSD